MARKPPLILEEQSVLWPKMFPGATIRFHVTSHEETERLAQALMSVTSVEVIVADIDSPQQEDNTVAAAERSMFEAVENERCRTVLDALTPAQTRVLRTIAKGFSSREVAQHLNLSEITVHSHKTIILAHCRRVWPPERTIGILFLRQTFGRFWEESLFSE